MAFIDNFVQLRNGGAAIDAERALEEVVAAVRETGKPGHVVIKIVVKPAEPGPEIDTLWLRDDITSKVPKKDKKQVLFFAAPNNQLSQQDVRQQRLPGMSEIDLRVESEER